MSFKDVAKCNLKYLPYLYIVVSLILAALLITLIAGFNYDPLDNFHIFGANGERVYGGDFRANYYAGKRFFTSDSLYYVEKQANKFVSEPLNSNNLSIFVYFPFSALFFYPLTLLSFNTAYLVMILLNILALFCSIFILSKYVTGKESYVLVSVLTIFFSLSFWALVERGQVDVIIFLFLVLCFYFFQQRLLVLSGIFLALAGMFKLTPFIFLPYFFFKQRRVFYVAMITIGVASLMVGVARVLEFFQVLKSFSQGVSTTYLSMGVLGVFYNKFTFSLVSLQVAHTIYLCTAVVFLLLILYYFIRKLPIGNKSNIQIELYEFGVLGALMTLLPTVSFIYHGFHLLFIMTFYWTIRQEGKLTICRMLLLDSIAFMLFSELTLFHSFSRAPLSYLFSLRPVYLIIFLVILYHDYIKIQRKIA